MSDTDAIRTGGPVTEARWGRVVVGAVATFLLLSGAYLALTGTPSTEDLRDSGVSWGELVATQPALAGYLQRLLRLAGVAAAGLAAISLGAALTLGRAGLTAWRLLWVLPASTAAFTVVLLVDGSTIGWFYAGMTAVGATGLLLARPRKEAR